MNKYLKKIKKHKELLSLIIILIFAFFLRIYQLGAPPLWIDESTSSMAARMILEKGIPRFDSGLLYSRAYFFHYTQAFFLLFSDSDFAVRFPSVVFGLLTIVLAYFIGKEYSKSGGILAALFTAVFYLEVFYSRQARFYQLFQLLFFASLYFLYKSKKNPKYLIPATITFILCLDTQIAGLVLAPFFLVHIFLYNKKYKVLSVIPGLYLIKYFIPTSTLTTVGNEAEAINYASQYFTFTRNMYYLLILFIPGTIWAFLKKKRLTTLIILPSIIMLFGIFTLKTFAFRYAYFFAFPLILYTSLLFAFLYDKFGKYIIPAIMLLLIIPSNLVYPYTYVNVIKPIDYNFNDYSSPTINLKYIPEDVKQVLEENTVIVYFSSTYEWYIGKPDLVLPFSMNGIGDDQISMIKDGEKVDEYSGAKILEQIPEKPYYLVADSFSVSKLKPEQIKFHSRLTKNCSSLYENPTLKILECLTESYARVTRIIDGDTLELSTGEKVRLICIDAPEENEKGYEEAKQYLKQLTLNKVVRLEKDVSETDQYGRLLRYVYVRVEGDWEDVEETEEEEEVFVNKQLVQKGYAEVFRYGEDTKRCGEIRG